MTTALYVDDVWHDPRVAKHRRIVAARGGKVMYSFGGHVNRWCKVKTFRYWVRKRKAELMFRAGVERVADA